MAYGPGQAYPPLPAVPPGSGFTGVSPAWLAGSADRERTVGVLRAAFTEGRLTQDELDDRVARAYAARTYGDLWALIADLPAGPLPYPAGLPCRTRRRVRPCRPAPSRTRSWHSAAALVITALVIFTLAALVTAIATAHAQPIPFQHSSRSSSPVQQASSSPSSTRNWLRSSRARGPGAGARASARSALMIV